ncbi:hypothetical protein KQX54_007907 [Cotesia glomerata]|uniref:Uncharacterized protein n=1 Tax=Cotesia glomerata TaxID=32391 RepID=A0AAV7IFG1_COTGL|nr:hypothetical protein KQX54_007907 [Cotesia glomerata]
MCKLFLISVILTSSLSLSFSTNNCSCQEKKDLYELKLSVNDPDVLKFAEDGWNKLVAEGRSRGATIRGSFSVQCARVQIVDTERRYTILVIYVAGSPGVVLFCVIFVMTTQTVPLSIICYQNYLVGNDDPVEREQRNIFNLFYRNNLFCPKE